MIRRKTLVVFIICSLVTIGGLFYLYCYRKNLWQVITAIATCWLIFVAYKELSDSNRISKGDFIHRFSDNFFGDETRDLITLLKHKALSFSDAGQFPHFVIDENKVKEFGIGEKNKEVLFARKRYSGYEIDDWLLGHLEDIAHFESSGLINIDQVYNHFDWYVDLVSSDSEINKYLEWLEKNEKDSKHIYNDLRDLGTKLKEYLESKK